MNAAAAVVVTYNRMELLKQNIKKLLEQSYPCDILVVDNASTDGTDKAMLSMEEAGMLLYRNTEANLGGAGGFNFGMRWAVEAGYSYIWVMDDDCLPSPDALEKLMEADKLLDGNYGWLSSVALWTDGRECKMNRQKLKKSFYEYTIMKAIYENYEELADVHAWGAQWIPENYVQKDFKVPYHDGAVKLYKEVGLWTDEAEATQNALLGK